MLDVSIWSTRRLRPLHKTARHDQTQTVPAVQGIRELEMRDARPCGNLLLAHSECAPLVLDRLPDLEREDATAVAVEKCLSD